MTEETQALDKNTRNGASALAMIGTALVIVGTFLTWISVSFKGYQGTTSPRSGLDWSGSTAIWLIVLASLAALTALGEITGWRILPSWVGRSVIVDGVIMAILAGSAMSDASKSGTIVYQGQTLQYQRHIGAGLWLSLVGAVVVVVAGYTLSGGIGGMWRGARAGKPADPPQTFALGERWPGENKPSDPPPNVSS